MTDLTNSTSGAKRHLAPTTSGSPLPPFFAERMREKLAKFLPSKIPFGLPLRPHQEHWEPQTNYIIGSVHTSDADAMTLTLAQQFADCGGHVIWMGTTADLHRISEQLMFKIADLELPAAGSSVQFDAIAQCKLKYAHEQIAKLWIDFCNVEDCGDTNIEQAFLESVSSFKPTLIVVDESIFDETTLDSFDMLVRQTHALRMVEELRGTSPMSSVLWHLPMQNGVASSMTMQRPSLDDLPDPASSIKPDVVLFTHRDGGSDSTELIVAANAYGPTGIVPMIFDSMRSTWHEFDATT